MKKKTFLVTGGTGFIGSGFVLTYGECSHRNNSH